MANNHMDAHHQHTNTMNTKHKHHRKPGLYLWLETGAFFFFSVGLCSLTFLGAAGVDPFVKHPPQVQTAKH